MALVSLHDVRLAHGEAALLDGVGLQVEAGERICLLGRNGAGKSTLLHILHGDLAPDGGRVTRQPHVRVALLGQDVPPGLTGTIRDVVSAQVPERREGPPVVDIVLTKMELPANADFGALSVGMKRRALLARALATEPDVLLLDEPTNHLDIEAIEWLEAFLLARRGSLVFVTHDRALTHRLATRILELDRGRLDSWACDYATFLRRREAEEATRQKQAQEFDEKLKQEEAWIRQGVQARRTRNEGRVRALLRMREERRQRRSAQGGARMQIQAGESTSKRVIEAEGLVFGYGDGHPVIRDFDIEIVRGDKIGLMGANGTGKTTLLRLLLGDLQPQAGRVRHGLRLQVAYFDQLRAQLDPERTVFDSVAHGSDRVEVHGRTKHVFAYLQDFLFTKEQTRKKVGVLSGGERNRLLLARLFTRPANVLALDEPTNDLDTETLEVLEAMLVDFPGTVLLVSHDRAFLDNVVSSTVVLDGSGRAHEYIGGYSDWLRQRPAPAATPASKPAAEADKTVRRPRQRPRKLSYKEGRELEALPGRIDELEAEVGDLHTRMSDPDSYTDGTDVAALAQRLQAAEAELAAAMDRWAELETLREALEGPA